MKFKGFWKSLWDVELVWFQWLKKYWFAYCLLIVVCTAVTLIPEITSYVKGKIEQKKRNKEQEEELARWLLAKEVKAKKPVPKAHFIVD